MHLSLMSDLPKNGDAVINTCLNCGNEFEENQKLGSWIHCDENDGGCGFVFKLSSRIGRLEKD